MSVKIKRGRGDPYVNAVKAALKEYVAEHPGAVAEVYRYNSASIRVRVVDERYAGIPFVRRHDDLWDYIGDRVPDDVMSEITFLIPVTAAEKERDMSSYEFDHPSSERL